MHDASRHRTSQPGRRWVATDRTGFFYCFSKAADHVCYPQRMKARMTRLLTVACLNLLLLGFVRVCDASAQSTDSIKFELTTKGGRKVFRIGEPIDLEFRFTYFGADTYQAVQEFSGRRVAFQSPDRFIVEPTEPVTDPFSDFFPETFNNPLARPPSTWKLSATSTVLDRRLNEWISLRKPGHYRITAESGIIAAGSSPVFSFVP